MAKINHAIIMAAGRGIRLMPLTSVIPKPLVPYLDTTLIGYGIKKLRTHLDNIHITAGYKGSILAQHVMELGVSSIFDTTNHGNSWWIYNTLLSLLDEPLMVLTCDNIVELDVDLLAQEYEELGQPACMLIPVKPVEGLEGDYIFEKKNLVYKLDRSVPSDIYCSGIQVINAVKINKLTTPCESFYDVWRQLIKEKQVYSSKVYPKKWFSVDTIDHLNQLNQFPVN
jgi:NDP-sugar pyrophosphorylase family protein